MMDSDSRFSHYSKTSPTNDGTNNLIQFVLAGCSFHLKKKKKGSGGNKKKMSTGIKPLSHANLEAFR